ncbi:hypothetical protein [Sphingomonas hengshuiensis]|nr:hypothetical protein [Sphingomonas hengshuiensis]
MDVIAEAVSLGKTLSAAAKAANISVFRAQALWARICARLGSQAI